MRASIASICLSVLDGTMALTIWLWIQIAAHQFIVLSGWIVALCYFFIAGPSDYYLVARGHGVAFEKKFERFSTRKKVILYFAAIGIVAAIAAAFIISVAAYHKAFNIRPN
jgi:hypothetical protein